MFTQEQKIDSNRDQDQDRFLGITKRDKDGNSTKTELQQLHETVQRHGVKRIKETISCSIHGSLGPL